MTPPMDFMASAPGAEHDDDAPVGRVLSRREALALLGGVGAAALLAGCAPGQSPVGQATATTGATGTGTPACVARPALTEGPYFVDEKLNRSDIRPDPSDGSTREGAPLHLTFNVSRVGAGCVPLVGAIVDVWHCDALGVYSDVTDPGFSTVGKKFLRGYQATDAGGIARFTTIYPGWYRGRAVHIHFKIRTGAGAGAAYEFTSQLFFDDALTDRVHAQAPYSSKGQGRLRNDGDGIYRGGGGQLLLTPAQEASGYAATFAIGLQLA